MFLGKSILEGNFVGRGDRRENVFGLKKPYATSMFSVNTLAKDNGSGRLVVVVAPVVSMPTMLHKSCLHNQKFYKQAITLHKSVTM